MQYVIPYNLFLKSEIQYLQVYYMCRIRRWKKEKVLNIRIHSRSQKHAEDHLLPNFVKLNLLWDDFDPVLVKDVHVQFSPVQV